jgi:ribonuclease P/MRP protein subunit RPP1
VVCVVGYTGIAWNVVVNPKNIVSCAIETVDVDALVDRSDKKNFKLPQYSLLRLQRESRTFQQKTRITVILEDMKDAELMTTKKALFQSYDIIAVRPKNEKMFQYACQNLDVDIISCELTDDLPFKFKFSTVGTAIGRGLVHEVSYAPLIRGKALC